MTGEAGRGVPFGRFVSEARARGELVVQPRMGFSDPTLMRTGLRATKEAAAVTAGTITIDSYTRVADERSVVRALNARVPLNGFPISSYSAHTSRWVLRGIHGPDFPVQVRHGSARPQHIVRALAELGLDATEGGPVSYCLPYGRTALVDSVRNWRESCEFLAGLHDAETEPHLETFGGCMLGQLCPPGLLVAISVLEAVFFHRHGLRSISLSYAQQTHHEQDREAIRALRSLAAELLPGAEWHIVLYTYMGLYPRTRHGALNLLRRSAELAVESGAARLIVKTTAEAHRIPTIEENAEALRTAAAAAALARRPAPVAGALDSGTDNPVYADARALVDAVLGLDPDIGRGLLLAFERGLLDIPFCLHPDNAGRSRSHIDETGRLAWSDVGSMPLRRGRRAGRRLSARGLYDALAFVQRRHDPAETESPRPVTGPAPRRGPTARLSGGSSRR